MSSRANRSSRRAFLQGASALSAGAALGAPALAGRGVWEHVLRLSGAPRNLVLVELSGGNDGLSTIVPKGDDALYRTRSTTAHEPKALLPLDDYRGFNPKLTRLHRTWKSGRMAIVEGCGYPNAIRSHFKSLEVWHTGRLAGKTTGNGWVGRLVADTWAKSAQPETVVHFGGRAPYSLHSPEFPPIALVSPTGYRWMGEDDVYTMGGTAICEHEPEATNARHAGRDKALAALRATLDDAAASSGRVRDAVAKYDTSVEYPKNRLSAALRDVAALIEGGVGTRVFSVAMGGYDTHTNQLQRHDRQMAGLDGALGAFLEDIGARGTEASKNTLVCVYSEFGRRVAENGSRGHDHGKAGPMFLFGAAVNGGLYGEHPSLDELDEGDLAHTTDFRRVFGTVIHEWFGGDAEAVLGGRYGVIDGLLSV